LGCQISLDNNVNNICRFRRRFCCLLPRLPILLPFPAAPAVTTHQLFPVAVTPDDVEGRRFAKLKLGELLVQSRLLAQKPLPLARTLCLLPLEGIAGVLNHPVPLTQGGLLFASYVGVDRQTNACQHATSCRM
jgi:hypothetical protein